MRCRSRFPGSSKGGAADDGGNDNATVDDLLGDLDAESDDGDAHPQSVVNSDAPG